MPLEQVRSQRRQERILESALRVFSQKGYHAAAVDDIATEAETSKGGVYFHFPTKQAIFLALLDRMAALLRSRVEAAIADEADPIAKADIALQVVLQTFASHRTLSRLFFVEALGAGREFHERLTRLRAAFAELIQQHLDEAVRQGAIPPLDTAVAGRVWFGALNEVLTSWVLSNQPGRLEQAYPTVRALLLRSIGAQVTGATTADDRARLESRAEPVSAPTVQRWRLDREALRDQLAAAARLAAQRGQPLLVSRVMPAPPLDPLLVFERASAFHDRLFWSRPRTGFALAGVGSAWTCEPTGPDRFQQAAAAWRALCAEALVEAPPDTIGVGPVLLGGFAFDPLRPATPLWEGFPPGRLVLPRYLATLVDGAAWLTANTLVEPSAEPDALADQAERELAELFGPAEPALAPAAAGNLLVESVLAPEQWQASVAAVRDDIRRGRLEKAVLARAVRVRGSATFNPAAALRELRAHYPSCFVFAVARGQRCFLGASPERLVRLRDSLVSTMCLAGSMARGASEAEDRRLGDALLASEKDRSEHEIVVRGLREALGGACAELAPVSTPVLLKVRNVQHLLTTVVGKVKPGQTILDLVERLHPTPAVGGLPRQAALALIREREQLDRGWYAGPVGWLDARGEGEMAVAIRSALLRGGEASLFVGCGIVADSDPVAEYAESELKLRPMLSALRGEAST